MSSLFDDLPLPGFEPFEAKPAADAMPVHLAEEPPPEDYDGPVGYEEEIPRDLFQTDYAAQAERDAYYRNGAPAPWSIRPSCWRG